MIVAGLAFAGWLIADDKRHFKVTGRQWLMMILLAYAGWTTLRADLYADALFKWEWVWKAMAWAIFLPLTLRTRLRIESYLLLDRKSTRLNSTNAHLVCRLLLEKNTNEHTKTPATTAHIVTRLLHNRNTQSNITHSPIT